MTQRRKTDSDRDYWNVIREAASCLAGGGLVAFPTETVYGLGANATDPAAVARLRDVKGRAESKPFTVHIGARSALPQFVPGLSGVGRRLAVKAWPGPLTLIFQVEDVAIAPVLQETSIEHAAAMYHEGTIGIRFPDDRVATDLLTEARVPIVAASANRAGEPAPVDADEVLSALDGQVDMVLDAGRTRYGKPSTIVRVNGTGFEVLREGVVDIRTLRRLASLCFLVVCTGNTCRSPMAQGLLRRLLAQRLGCDERELADRGYCIESAGTGAFGGLPASQPALNAMQSLGIDISDHCSQPLTVELINRADHIFTMTGAHRDAVFSLSTLAGHKTRTLADEDIEDPMGQGDDVYQRCAQRIETALRKRLEEIPL